MILDKPVSQGDRTLGQRGLIMNLENREVGRAFVDHHSVTEVSVAVISNLGRVRVCLEAGEVPAAGSLPEPGPVLRSGPYP